MNTAPKAEPGTAAANADLARTVHRTLCANRHGCNRIIVKVEEGNVRLSGLVHSFFVRQMAIALAKQVIGVRQVIDDLEVDREEIRVQEKG